MKKKIIKNGIIAGLLLFTSVAVCDTPHNKTKDNIQYIDVKFKVDEDNIVYVNFKKIKGKTVNIRFFDGNSGLIHTEKIKQNNAVLRKYNVNDIQNNPFSFEVIDTQMIKRKFNQK